jgi:sulfite reductase (ferredoxin)
MSNVETIKLLSKNLRGTIAQSLAAGGSRFDEADAQILKFHGMYQQEDRDLRAERKKAGQEPAWQFMLRSRIPGGALTPEQYLVHDALADRVGNATLRFTTRQGIQMHGILKGDLRTAIRKISKTLLSTIAACGDVNRNVMACPAPPRTAAQEAVQRLAHDLAVHFTPKTRAYHEIWIDGERVDTPEIGEEPVDPIYGRTYLPRKFKMGVTTVDDNCIDAYTQDIAFVAIIEGERLTGYNVLAGGGMGMTHGKATTYPRLATPLCFIEPSEAIALAEAIVTVQRDYGDRTNRKHARFKYLVEERGIAWLKTQVEERTGLQLERPRESAFADACDHLGWRLERDGTYSLGMLIENGRVKDNPRALVRTGLRTVVERFCPKIRLTGQQNILLLGIAAEHREVITSLLRKHGIETDPQAHGIARYAMACPALPTCGLALTDAERALPEIVAQFQRDLDELVLGNERITVRMTGCPNGCARPYMGDVGIVGRSRDLYDLFVGGDAANTRLNLLYKSGVRRGELAAELYPLLRAWKDEREPGEAFGDYCNRVGVEYLRRHPLLERHA